MYLTKDEACFAARVFNSSNVVGENYCPQKTSDGYRIIKLSVPQEREIDEKCKLSYEERACVYKTILYERKVNGTSSRKLASDFGVSRELVRKAVKNIEEDNYIFKEERLDGWGIRLKKNLNLNEVIKRRVYE